MTSKLILKNIKKNISNYLIYFATLILTISVFYAFNAAMDPQNLGHLSKEMEAMTRTCGDMIGYLTRILAVILGFLVIYVNRFFVKRRKREIGTYMILGMSKRQISNLLMIESIVVGFISIIVGIVFGVFLAQFLTAFAIKSFGGVISGVKLAVSMKSLKLTIQCFVIIYLLAVVINIVEIGKIKLIDLLNADRKNQKVIKLPAWIYIVCLLVGVAFLVVALKILKTDELLPSLSQMTRGGLCGAFAIIFLVFGAASIILYLLKSNAGFYYTGIRSFVIRQIESKLSSSIFSISAMAVLLTITLTLITVGYSIAWTMTDLTKKSAPFDFVLLMDVNCDTDDILLEANKCGVDLYPYIGQASAMTYYKSGITYGELFEGQDVELWHNDEEIGLLDRNVGLLTLSDYNEVLLLQGKEPVELNDDEYLLNGYYKGDVEYLQYAASSMRQLSINDHTLKAKSQKLFDSTIFMTSIGDEDRGFIVVADSVVSGMEPSIYYLEGYYSTDDVDLVQSEIMRLTNDENGDYMEDTYFAWNTKSRMQTMYYTAFALPVFICSFVGVIFLLVCVALLSVQQLTEVSENQKKYEILQKQGVSLGEVNRAIAVQIAIYFAAPLVIGGLICLAMLPQIMNQIKLFFNLEISTNSVFTMSFLIILYGTYYVVTYLSCKKMIVK